jgi:hypothetical protein
VKIFLINNSVTPAFKPGFGRIFDYFFEIPSGVYPAISGTGIGGVHKIKNPSFSEGF